MMRHFLQIGVMGCSRGFGACGQLVLTAVLNFLRYSGGLKEIVGVVRLAGAQENRRADARNSQELSHRGEGMRIM
jgi:hypothetical protein